MLVERGELRPVGRHWALDPTATRRDAADGAGGHRQPARPARPDRPGGAAGRRGGRAPSSGRAPVAAALGRPVEWVVRSLHRLQQRDLVVRAARPRRWPASRSTAFRHVLVRDVCYQRLPRAERVTRHQRTADWLEQLTDSRQHRPGRGAGQPPLGGPRDRPDLGMDTAPYAPAARAALHRAARRAYALHALDAAADAGRPGAGPDAGPRPGAGAVRRRAGVLPRRRRVPGDGGGAEHADRAGRAAGPPPATGRGGARAGRCSATAAWSRADRSATLRCLDRAVGMLRATCRTAWRRRAPCWSWPGCT